MKQLYWSFSFEVGSLQREGNLGSKSVLGGEVFNALKEQSSDDSHELSPLG